MALANITNNILTDSGILVGSLLTTSSAASTYVPYTGATADLVLGNRLSKANSFYADGDGSFTSGGLFLKQYASGATNITGYNIITTQTSGFLFSASVASSFKNFILDASSLTDVTQRTYTLPDASGTLALTSSLSGMVTGTGTNNYIPKFTTTGSTIGNSSIQDLTTGVLINNSVTAASAIAMGTNLTPTLTAAANNDVLVGLDINPTFTNGAFTGVSNVGLRTQSILVGTSIITGVTDAVQVKLSNATVSLQNTTATNYAGVNMYDDSNTLAGSFAIGGTAASVPSLAGNFLFGARRATGKTIIVGGVSATQLATMFSTGNFLIQNSGTHTDAGFRLDVNGTARVQGALTTTGNITIANATYYQSLTSTGTAVRMLGINAGNVAYVGAIDAGAVSTIFNASSTSLTASFYTSGTEKLTINSVGSVGIGTTSLTGITLALGRTLTGATDTLQVNANGVIQSDSTNTGTYFRSTASTAAATFTLGSVVHYRASQGTFGVGSTITNQYGVLIDSTLIGATNNYGFFGNIASGTNRWNLYMNGTANNYMAGKLLIGTTTDNGQGTLQNTGSAFLGGLQVGGLTFSTSTTATTSTIFYYFNGGSGQTLTLPSTVGISSYFLIKNAGTAALTISRSGSTDTIMAPNGTSTSTTISLAAGSQAILVSNGAFVWIQIV